MATTNMTRPRGNVVNLRRRVWLLLLLDGSERAGVVPISKLRLHRLAYLADALSPLYRLPVADGRIVKYRRGPYYPDVQWDLDRMALQGLVKIFSLEHKRDKFGWWLDAQYGLSQTGLRAVDSATVLADVRSTHQFLVEIATAYADTRGEVALNDIALQDVNFHNPLQELNTLIDFADPQQNLALLATEAMKRIPPGFETLPQRDRLHLYFRYLERALNKAVNR